MPCTLLDIPVSFPSSVPPPSLKKLLTTLRCLRGPGDDPLAAYLNWPAVPPPPLFLINTDEVFRCPDPVPSWASKGLFSFALGS